MREERDARERADWTAGAEAIVYQRCADCRQVWYFARSFCPHCGSHAVDDRRASGRGVVHAASLVARAPSAELRPYAPYLIVLVDAEEGFRLMAHGEPSLRIGDAVAARFRSFGDRLVPYFDRVPPGEPCPLRV